MLEKNDYWEEKFIEKNEKYLNNIYFDNCIFKKCNFSKSIFDTCKFTECTFINCDLSLCVLKNCTFNDVTFKNSKLLGVSWSNCVEPFDVIFECSNISQNSFHLLDLRKMKFLACLINDSGFEECNLENALFDNCNLEQTVFVNNNMKKANFETSRNYLIDPNHNDIKKAQFSLPEALSFLSLLPIRIK